MVFRYNPALRAEGKNPFSLDTKKLTLDVEKVLEGEMRYGNMKRTDPKKLEKILHSKRVEKM